MPGLVVVVLVCVGWSLIGMMLLAFRNEKPEVIDHSTVVQWHVRRTLEQTPPPGGGER